MRSADFEQVLGVRSRMLSAHFAIHHLGGVPLPLRASVPGLSGADLSTGGDTNSVHAVDESEAAASATPSGKAPLPRLWFGAVVPKRHARRAVTRTLVKRQIRAAVLTHAEALAAGLWVVRLRAAFDPASYVSASSVALRLVVRDELDRLLGRCGVPATGR